MRSLIFSPAGTKSRICSWLAKPHFLKANCGDPVVDMLPRTIDWSIDCSDRKVQTWFQGEFSTHSQQLVQGQSIDNHKNGWLILDKKFIWLQFTSMMHSFTKLDWRTTCSMIPRIEDGNCVWHFIWATDLSWKSWEKSRIPSWRRTDRRVSISQCLLRQIMTYFRVHAHITRSESNDNTSPVDTWSEMHDDPVIPLDSSERSFSTFSWVMQSEGRAHWWSVH